MARWTMRYEKYNKDKKLTLRCRHFNPTESSCCTSCHEDIDYDYPLSEQDHPKNTFITAEVCCGILNNELDELEEKTLLQIWEDALERYEEEFQSE
jgi:hypothetical protein